MPDDMTTLEHTADHHRAHAANALSDLVDRFAPEKLGQQAISDGSALAERFGRAALREAKRNPAGVALIGVGAALLLSNMARTPAPQAAVTAELGSESDRIAAADARIKAKARIAAPTSSSSNGLRARIDAGLDRLSPEARARVTQARLKAVDAQEALERHGRKISAQAKVAHADHPLATGLAAAGIGGLIAALLPSTRTEGALLGAKRDQMLRHAESIWQAEVAALEARGKEVVTASVDAAKDRLDAQASV